MHLTLDAATKPRFGILLAAASARYDKRMNRRFQFSLASVLAATTIFALAALFARVFMPISFLLGGCATGTVVRKPGYGLTAGLFVFCLWFCLWDLLRLLGYR